MTKFRDLLAGELFDFINDDDRTQNSFHKRCKKTSARRYEDEDGVVHRIGSVNATVYHVTGKATS